MADMPQRALETEGPKPPVVALPDDAGPSEGSPTVAERLDRLARLVEAEVVPRLVLAHRIGESRGPPAPPLLRPSEEEVDRLAALVVDQDLPAARASIEALRGRGVSIEGIFLDLLAPAARRLGRWWEDDRRSFAEVTIGLWRLHQLLHELSPAFQADAVPPNPDLRALLVTAPGEQHSFGLVMAAEFFRRAGWLVSGGPQLSSDEIQTLVHREPFAIVGISAASDGKLDSVASTIHGIRRASRNPACNGAAETISARLKTPATRG